MEVREMTPRNEKTLEYNMALSDRYQFYPLSPPSLTLPSFLVHIFNDGIRYLILGFIFIRSIIPDQNTIDDSEAVI